jgi:hypothetical protein
VSALSQQRRIVQPMILIHHRASPKNVRDDIMLAECQIEILTSTGESDFEC